MFKIIFLYVIVIMNSGLYVIDYEPPKPVTHSIVEVYTIPTFQDHHLKMSATGLVLSLIHI